MDSRDRSAAGGAGGESPQAEGVRGELMAGLDEPCPLCPPGEGRLRLVRRGYRLRVECQHRLGHVGPGVYVTWAPSPPPDAQQWEAQMAVALAGQWGMFVVRLLRRGHEWQIVEARGDGTTQRSTHALATLLSQWLSHRGLAVGATPAPLGACSPPAGECSAPPSPGS